MKRKIISLCFCIVLVCSFASCTQQVTTIYSNYEETQYIYKQKKDYTVSEQNNTVTYKTGDGKTYTLDKNVNIFEYTLGLYTKSAKHMNSTIEQEILRLCNEEREKAGMAPLEWCEEAYYFTQIRAKEYFSKKSHTRPNGKKWTSVYSSEGIILTKYNGELYMGENLAACMENLEGNLPTRFMELWLNSPEHKEAILNPNFKKMCVAIWGRKEGYFAAQHFFG